ncbi:MAG: 3-deoxy-manno-octulosonate cytidylyltransferase [Verrucomicrobia bacterium]|nr:3-deoxy-manno-octulosonate cytidylyltransferase [Verrucomicrobiota bacterium]
MPQADGQWKPRPGIILCAVPPFGDLLVCGISRQLHLQVVGFDEVISPRDLDFSGSGLHSESLIRLGFLAEYTPTQIIGVIGAVSAVRHQRLRVRLASFLAPRHAPLGRILGLIPARYASTRFPGKPLHPIAGKPLLQHVVERCRLAKSLSEVIVATDDERIRDVARQFCRVEMTRPEHPSGTDRIAEVAARCECDAVVNIQGDEPLIDPTVIDAVEGALADNEMSTAATPIKDATDYDNPNVVKVVADAAGRALYFSRRTIPFVRDAASRPAQDQLAAFPFLKHLGIYGYRRETLLRLVRFPVSPLEAAEKLEQLRALENGIEIAVVRVDYDSVGVDVPGDVGRVERMLRR